MGVHKAFYCITSVAFKEFLAHFGTELLDTSEDKISKGNV
jgi:hypothetical protein